MTEPARIPIDDTGDGGVTLDIHLTGEPVTWGGWLTLAETLTRSALPVRVIFQPLGPPPVFLSLAEASRVVGVDVEQIKRWVRSGHLPAVSVTLGLADQRAPHEVDGEQVPDPNDPHAARLIPYDALEAFAMRAKTLGHFPYLSPEVREQLREGPRKGPTVYSLVLHVMEAAYPDALSLGEVHRAVLDHLAATDPDARRPSTSAISNALGRAIRDHKVHNAAINPKNKRRKTRRYHWYQPKGKP